MTGRGRDERRNRRINHEGIRTEEEEGGGTASHAAPKVCKCVVRCCFPVLCCVVGLG